MSRRRRRLGVAAACLVMPVAAARAQVSGNPPAPAAAANAVPGARPPARPTEFRGDIAVVNTGGNTEVTTINVGNTFRLVRGRLTLAQNFGFLYGENQGTRNTEIWRAGLRGDVRLVDGVSVHAVAAFDRNTFAGIARRLELSGGFGWVPVEGAHHRWHFEGGGGLILQRNTARPPDNFPIARAATTYRYTFRTNAYVQQFVEFLPNLRESVDWRFNSESALVAPLSKRLAIKASYVIRFDNLPEPGFRRSDRILSTGLQVTL